jgi:hypothetical protein
MTVLWKQLCDIARLPNGPGDPLAIPALVLAVSGCTTELLEMEPGHVVLTEAHGWVRMPADEIEYLQCDDGLLLQCETGSGRLSDRDCRCLR